MHKQYNKAKSHLASKYWLSGVFLLFHDLRESDWWRRGGTAGFHANGYMDGVDISVVRAGIGSKQKSGFTENC